MNTLAPPASTTDIHPAAPPDPASAGRGGEWRWPLAFALATAAGLLSFAYYWLDDLARGRATSPLEPLIEELTGVWGFTLLLPLVVRLARRVPPRVDPRFVAAHLAGVLVTATLATSWNWVVRSLLFPPAGLGRYDYGRMPLRYLMELPKVALIYASVVAFVTLWDRYRRARERELRARELETLLVRAQLRSLHAQLQPHFLFNALNTVSSVMYDDVRAADRMLASLSELLRCSLRSSGAQEIPLAEEMEMLERYLELMRARFGERLEVEVEVEDGIGAARVPALVLQPLVENAVEHGAPEPPLPACVRVSAARGEGGTLVLEVRDNGPGLAGDPLGTGVGLTNTAERLRALYADAQSLSFGRAPEGGLAVRVTLPLREEPWSASAS